LQLTSTNYNIPHSLECGLKFSTWNELYNARKKNAAKSFFFKVKIYRLNFFYCRKYIGYDFLNLGLKTFKGIQHKYMQRSGFKPQPPQKN